MAYGYGTQSHIKSTEFKQLKKAREEFTAKYEAGEVKFKPLDMTGFMSCACRSFRYPHPLEAHKKLKNDRDWRPFEQREREDAGRVIWSEVR
jgi:hypothetical protein